MTSRRSLGRYIPIVALALLLALVVAGLCAPDAHAASEALPIPWLDDIVAQLLAALVKVLQDLMKGIGILLWAVLKLCGLVGLLGADFSTLFNSIIVEAIGAVVGGSIATVIRGSLMVSLGFLGLSLLAKPFWPDLNLVKAQRIVLWGTVIQAYLLHAPAIYTQLEALRTGLSEEVAQAVSAGAVPGCSGNTVEVILCMTGTNPAEVQAPDLTALPDTLPPYGGSETVHDLYDHCVYNPPAYYGDAACDADDPTGDPWAVLAYAQEALGSQALSIILGLLILAYGVLQIALGLAAGMMFVLFPVAAIFAFYTPLESFPVGVVRNCIAIFLKSVVLLTLAAVVIRLFTVAAGNLISLAAVGLIGLLLCGIMAKEALGAMLGSVSFIGSSVSSLGASFGLGGGGGGASGYASPESRLAASTIGGPLAQTLIGAPNPYMHSAGGGLVGMVGGAPGRAMGAVGGSARAAVTAAMGAATGGAGFLLGAAAAAKGAGFGSLALGSSAASTLSRSAGRGFTLGAVAGRTMRRKPPSSRPAPAARRPVSGQPSPRGSASGASTPAPSAGKPASAASQSAPSPHKTSPPPAAAPVQAIMAGRSANLSGWQPAGAQRITEAGTRLREAPDEVQGSVADLMQASYTTAQQWESQGYSPFQEDGGLDPQFTEEVIQQVPAAARAFTVGQAKANLPAGKQVSLSEVVALGTLSPGTPPTASPATPEGEPYDAEQAPTLFEQLRTWRRDTADGLGKAAFHVFPDATLQRIAAAQPQTEEELLAVKGVGPKKLEQFGEAVLDITAQGAGKQGTGRQGAKEQGA